MFLIWLFLNTLFTVLFLTASSSSSLFETALMLTWGLILTKLFMSSNHVLMVLLILEVFMLVTMMVFISLNLKFSSNAEFFMVFFTLAVCEASLGLGLLIQLSRKTGSELTSSM